MKLPPSYFVDKESRILELSKGRKVLHLGCVGNTDCSTEEKVKLASGTLHAKITEVASRALGIDLDREAVESLINTGVFDNIQYGDACELSRSDIGFDWELVVVGDLIEHVSNPGLLLDSIRGVMSPATRLVFTTPNAFSLPAAIRFALGKFAEGREHVMSFNHLNIQQLLERHDLKPVEIGTCYQPYARASPLFGLGKFFFSLCPKYGGTLFVSAEIRNQE